MPKPEAKVEIEEREQHPRRRPSFSRGVFFTGSGSALNIAFLFLETMIAVRLLDPDSYGIYVLLIATVNFFVMAIDIGGRTAVTQLIASSDPSRQSTLANSALILRLLVIAVVSVLIWVAQPLIRLIDPALDLSSYIVYIPLMLIVASFDELLLGMLQGFHAYQKMAIAQIIRSILRLGLTVLFLSVLKLGIMALIYSWIISFGISMLYQYLTLPMSKRFVFQRPVLRELIHFGFPLQLSRFLWFAFSQVHVLLLGTLAGPASAAYYSVAARIPNALQRLSESYIAVYFPTTAGLLAEGKRDQAVRMVNDSLRLISFVTAVVALTSVVFSREIITLLFSETYAISSPAFALLMIAFHMTFVLSLMGYTLTAAGYPGRALGENVIRTGLTLLGDLLLIPAFGFMGPVYAGLIGRYVANPVAAWLLRRSGVALAIGPYAKQTVLLLLGAGLFWWLQLDEFIFKIAIVVLFVGLNLALSTVSPGDLRLLLPRTMTKRLGVPSEL